MAVGVDVSLENPKYLTTGLCLIHAVLPKEAWLLKRGLDYEWPCQGLPRAIHSDSGNEFNNQQLVRVADRYEFDLYKRRLRISEDGGVVEAFAKTLNRQLQTLAGTTFGNPKERGEYQSSKFAHMTLDELEVFIGHFMAGEYPNLPHAGLGGQTPLSKWNEGWMEDSSGLPRGNPRLVENEDTFRIELLPCEYRPIRQEGIEWECNFYNCDELDERIGSRDLVEVKKLRKFRFHFDPRDIRFIYFYDPDREVFVLVPCVDRTLEPMSLLEWRHTRKEERIRKKLTEDRPTAARARKGKAEVAEKSKRETTTQRRKRAKKSEDARNNTHIQLEESGFITLPKRGGIDLPGLRPSDDVDDSHFEKAWEETRDYADIE